jgi:DNA-binding Lrp family transcriptional regulator
MNSIQHADRTDLLILKEFDLNARASLQVIADNIGESKQLVQYRIATLKKKGFLKNFFTIIDFSALGLLSFRVYFRLKNLSRKEEDDLTHYFVHHAAVFWVARLEGSWDLEIAIAARNFVHFNTILKKIFFERGAFSYRHNVSMSPISYHFPRDYLATPIREGFTDIFYGQEPVATPIDEIDRKLLLQLAQNARTELKVLAKRLRTGITTVKHKMAELERKRIIRGYRASFPPHLLGRTLHKALLRLINLSPHVERSIHEFCAKYSSVIYITEVLGEWNLEVEGEMNTSAEMLSLVRELRRAFPENILDYEMVRVTKEEKLTYLPINWKKEQ